MERVRPQDPFLVQMQEGPGFGIEETSAATIREALDYAVAFHLEFFPDWVQIVDRDGKVIFTPQQTEERFEKYCTRMGIKTYNGEVCMQIV
jgi:hypothetical protein